MNGLECCKEIRNLIEGNFVYHSKIIALSSIGSDHEKEKCLAIGMDDYILRPVLKSNILDTLFKHLYKSEKYSNNNNNNGD